MPNPIVQDPMLEQWLRGALLLPDAPFTPIDPASSPLFARPLLESKGAVSVLLEERVDPHRGIPGVRWGAASAAGMDLLRAHYQAAGLHLTLTESINFVFLRAGAAPPSGRRAYLEGLIRTVVKTNTVGHNWEFALPPEVENRWDSLLLSNRNAPPLGDLQSRHDRADLLLWEETAFFLFYKKVDQKEGFQRLDQWFSAEARNTLHRR